MANSIKMTLIPKLHTRLQTTQVLIEGNPFFKIYLLLLILPTDQLRVLIKYLEFFQSQLFFPTKSHVC